MAVLDYTDLTAMSTLVTELAGTTPTDLDSLLTDSAGKHTNDTVTIYRPYYVAARILDRQANTTRLREARGARFDPPAVRIHALRKQQATFDEAMLDDEADYEVPPGHRVYASTQLVF